MGKKTELCIKVDLSIQPYMVEENLELNPDCHGPENSGKWNIIYSSTLAQAGNVKFIIMLI